MKINCITSYKSSINLNQTPNNRRQNVSFGFGEDFGYNPFVDPEPDDNVPNPSLINCIKYGIKLPFVIGSELFGKAEKQRIEDIERIGRLAEEQEKRERLQSNQDDDVNTDDY